MKNISVKILKELLASMPDDALIAIHEPIDDGGFTVVDSVFLSKAKLYNEFLYNQDYHSGELVTILLFE
jgi:hypothetical protein